MYTTIDLGLTPVDKSLQVSGNGIMSEKVQVQVRIVILTFYKIRMKPEMDIG